jgi:hypothetical protein
MSSKLYPWDFFKSFPKTLDQNKMGAYFFNVYDPYIEKILINKIPKKEVGGEWRTILGNEITIEWIENNLNTLNLFSTKESYVILMAQQISPAVKKYILEGSCDWSERFLLFFFSKEDKFFDEATKKKLGVSLKILEPRFWEGQKLLRFCCEQLQSQLPYDIQNFIIESVENTPAEFIHALKTISIHFPNPQSIKLCELKELVHADRVDQFKLANLLGKKDWESFFQCLFDYGENYDILRGIFGFLQGHMIKLADNSYMAKKARLSKYDKEIQSHSRLWNPSDLRSEMNFFGQMEILAKSKSPQLISHLRVKHQSFYI